MSSTEQLLQIAGIVNSYHNGRQQTKAAAVAALRAIADVLGEPFQMPDGEPVPAQHRGQPT